MTCVSDYKSNAKWRAGFNRLARAIFGIDFERYYQSGFWDERYVCHSILKDGQIISNVSTTPFELMINGKAHKAIQIGTVMTHKAFRGQGLAVELTRQVIDQYRSQCDFFYLFGHKEVWSYYTKQHFVPITESYYAVEVHSGWEACLPLRQLDLTCPADLVIIRRLTRQRVPVSHTLGVVRDTSIFLFYCLYFFSDSLFYSKALDCLIVLTLSEEKIVHLYDVLCPSDLCFEMLLALIRSKVSDIERLVFYFAPTYPDIIVPPVAAGGDDKMFFMGDSAVLPRYFLYPQMAQT